jgi:very-short-patch-repair endonuclease
MGGVVVKYKEFGRCVDRCESPIERRFLTALLFLGDYTFEPVVDGYRVDFTLSHPGAKDRLAIELDGFVHHGSTPAQFERDAARQRAITARGWTVIRFSGREVNRDPRRCAAEAMHAAASIVDAAQAEAEAKPSPRAPRPINEEPWEVQMDLARAVERAARVRQGLVAQ